MSGNLDRSTGEVVQTVAGGLQFSLIKGTDPIGGSMAISAVATLWRLAIRRGAFVGFVLASTDGAERGKAAVPGCMAKEEAVFALRNLPSAPLPLDAYLLAA
ncbi:uncharacterized protein LOC124461699 [Drosophila willistoni]|uniref:uncharacterized protein LOC124461699 n=1 Tax=Drosophila willistoni TaxID=7260 RepID=UPI001F0886ED|nr:uncharacterized protein LOC124461699 [Drosophila willistoni]